MNVEDVLLYIGSCTLIFEIQSPAAVDFICHIPVNHDQSGERLHKNVVDGEYQNSMKFI